MCEERYPPNEVSREAVARGVRRGTAAEDVKVFVGGVEAAGRGGFLPPKQTGAQFIGKPY